MENSRNSSCNDFENASIKIRTPKRILHFSDGILEEYSDEENETSSNVQTNTTTIDLSTLSWGSWLIYKSWTAGTMALSACDYLGENLAYFFGISTPKYWAEIEEYKRMQAEESERQTKAVGWSVSSDVSEGIDLPEIKTSQPVSTNC